MAQNTDPRLQKQLIYSIYVRAHSEEGSFRAVIEDLDRIRALGADILWFLPIHPIGVQGKKGSLGCPYANRDYRGVNPAYGTMEDFKALADEIHARGMKLMIDVVYNHTSPDSVLYAEHPEFFYHRPDGSPCNRVGDWSDVIDLDYSNPGLWDYQIETLCTWAGIVDGFRCDAAPLVPLAFWKAAREAVAKVKPDFIWLAETIHPDFGNFCRRTGIGAARDTEMFEVFDLEYEYDVRGGFEAWLRGERPLSAWLDLLNLQEALYPDNYNKLRFLENHDQPRIAALVPDEQSLVNYTALLYFLKGTTLIYAGQEFENTHTPSLFEREPIDRGGENDLSELMRRLYQIRRDAFGAGDWFEARADDEHGIAILQRGSGGRHFCGVFSLRGESADVSVPAPDGIYTDLITGMPLSVKNSQIFCVGEPMIFTWRD